jgi:hypothetical protein
MRLVYIIFFIFTSALSADVKSVTGQINFDTQMDNQAEMTLNSTGLGIGITPSANLHVNGNAIITNQIFVGEVSGSSNLNVNGTLGYGIQNINSDTTLDNTSIVLVDSSSDNISITLPYAANVTGRIYTIKKIHSENSILLISASNLIDTSDYYVLSSGNLGCIEVFASSDGNWKVLNSNEGVSDAWTPSDITTNLWFDANDTSTVQVGASNNVYQWNEKSGEGNNLNQGVSSDLPITSLSGIGGLNSVFFDGDDSLETETFVTNMDNIEVYIVFQANVLNNQQLFDIREDVSTTPLLDDGSQDGFSTRRRNDASSLTSTATQTKDTNAHIGYYAYDSLSDLMSNRLDGQNEISQSSTSTTSGSFFLSLGQNGKSALGGINGWVGEVIVITSLSSVSSRQKIEGYLAHKWNLTSNLSTDHPYKIIPPY